MIAMWYDVMGRWKEASCMRKKLLIGISVLVLFVGVGGLYFWHRQMSPGDAFSFSILAAFVVWPVCAALSAAFWALSGAKNAPFYLLLVVFGVIEPIIVFYNMFDAATLVFGVIGAVLPAAVVISIVAVIREKRGRTLLDQ